ncbi:MAG: diheme cytochrome c [Sedimenticola sp.]|nr:diheme cytochrome c [Sedimenticola sp.]
MKKTALITTLIITIGLIAFTSVVISSNSDEAKSMRSWFKQTKNQIDPLQIQRYTDECGSCHFPYQPGLLPATSWEQIINNLDDHFGENAELPESQLKSLRNYLLNNAAGRTRYGLPNKIMAAQGDHPLPLRITELRYFLHEHSEIPSKMVQDNPNVKSFSNCDRCHQSARQGLYDEHDVRIPGVGRWDD